MLKKKDQKKRLIELQQSLKKREEEEKKIAELEAEIKKEEEALKEKEEAEQKLLEEAKKEEAQLKIDTKNQPYDHVKRNNWFSPKRWIETISKALSGSRTVLVQMEQVTGSWRTFYIKESDNGFRWRGKRYLFDNSLKYWNVDSKIWCYTYHEEITLPIRMEIPVNDIKTSIETSKVVDVIHAINPKVLERYLESKIEERMLQGQALNDVFKYIKTIVTVLFALSLIHLFLFMSKTGMLSQIKIPFISG